jgi:hypothetical protein
VRSEPYSAGQPSQSQLQRLGGNQVQLQRCINANMQMQAYAVDPHRDEDVYADMKQRYLAGEIPVYRTSFLAVNARRKQRAGVQQNVQVEQVGLVQTNDVYSQATCDVEMWMGMEENDDDVIVIHQSSQNEQRESDLAEAQVALLEASRAISSPRPVSNEGASNEQRPAVNDDGWIVWRRPSAAPLPVAGDHGESTEEPPDQSQDQSQDQSEDLDSTEEPPDSSEEIQFNNPPVAVPARLTSRGMMELFFEDLEKSTKPQHFAGHSGPAQTTLSHSRGGADDGDAHV